MNRMSSMPMSAHPPLPLPYIVPPCTLATVMALLDNDPAYVEAAELVASPNPARAFYCFAMLCYYKPRLRELVCGERWERFFESFALIVEDHLEFKFTASETLHHFCALLFC